MKRRKIRRLIRREQGLEVVEYAVLAGVLTAGVLGAVATLGGQVGERFEFLRDHLAWMDGDGPPGDFPGGGVGDGPDPWPPGGN